MNIDSKQLAVLHRRLLRTEWIGFRADQQNLARRMPERLAIERGRKGRIQPADCSPTVPAAPPATAGRSLRLAVALHNAATAAQPANGRRPRAHQPGSPAPGSASRARPAVTVRPVAAIVDSGSFPRPPATDGPASFASDRDRNHPSRAESGNFAAGDPFPVCGFSRARPGCQARPRGWSECGNRR